MSNERAISQRQRQARYIQYMVPECSMCSVFLALQSDDSNKVPPPPLLLLSVAAAPNVISNYT